MPLSSIFLFIAYLGAFLNLPEPYSVQRNSPEKAVIEWLSLDQALEKSKSKPKKILIDVYTNWCEYCKKMDKQVYQNAAIIQKINQDFYAVKLNAEQLQPITIQGTTYQYNQEYKAHELAISLLKGDMSFPTTVFLNERQQVMERVQGFVPPKDFIRALEYITQQ